MHRATNSQSKPAPSTPSRFLRRKCTAGLITNNDITPSSAEVPVCTPIGLPFSCTNPQSILKASQEAAGMHLNTTRTAQRVTVTHNLVSFLQAQAWRYPKETIICTLKYLQTPSPKPLSLYPACLHTAGRAQPAAHEPTTERTLHRKRWQYLKQGIF